VSARGPRPRHHEDVRALAISFLLAGCYDCPGSVMEVSGGVAGEVRPGDTLVLRAHYGDEWQAGPEHCGGNWSVNHVLGGSPEVGTIDTCGRYQAPPAFTPGLELVVIEAADFTLPDGCADCCPYASVALEARP
jgi:hypothetical protein